MDEDHIMEYDEKVLLLENDDIFCGIVNKII